MPSEVAAATPPEPVNGDGWFRCSADESATGTTTVMHMLARKPVPRPASRSKIE